MKMWEKIMLYPIGLCYWIADHAKKTGKFIERKTKPAIAMLVTVTMLLSVMPMTAFATTSSVGVTPMTTSDSIRDAKETVFYMKWNTDNAVLKSTSDKNIKTAYVRLYILGHISALSGYQSTWNECKITTSIDETTGAKITYVDLYFTPSILQTTNANAYCYMTVTGTPYGAQIYRGDIGKAREFGGTVSFYLYSDYSTGFINSYQIGINMDEYKEYSKKATGCEGLESATIDGDGTYVLPTTTTISETINAVGKTDNGTDAGVTKYYYDGYIKSYSGYIIGLTATDAAGNKIPGVTPHISDSFGRGSASISVSPDVYSSLADDASTLSVLVSAKMQMVDPVIYGNTGQYFIGSPISDDVTLTFSRPTQTVLFDTNGGSAIAPQTVYYHAKAAEPTTPTRTGYAFEGWYADSACTQEFDFENTDILSDTTVYAKWKAHTHEWKYIKDGNKITASCSNTDGTCTDTSGGYVTLSVPSDLTYTGSKIEAVVDNKLTTGATVEVKYIGNTTEGSSINAGDYTASIALDSQTMSVSYTIEKATPTADDFVFAAPTDLIYDGTAKPATVTVKDGIVGMGKVNVIYFRDAGPWINNDGEPIYPGRYKVGIWIEEGDNYNAVYSDQRIWLGSEFEVKYLATDAKADISGTVGSNGWYTNNVTLLAPDGYQISGSLYDTYGESITFTNEQNETVTYYLRNADGDIAEKTLELKIDKTAPVAKYQIGTDGWKQFINTITFGLFCKDYKTVDIEYTDDLSGVAKKQYYISSEEITDTSSIAWLDYTGTLSLNATGKYFIYMRVVDNAGHEVILNAEGIVIYEDSVQVTESVSATYKAGTDKYVTVELEGNTISKIVNGKTALTTGTDYTVSADGVITLKADYLDTLNVGEYTFTVSYNPQGVETDKVDMTTAFTVEVEKADGKVSNISDISKTYDDTAITAPTFDKLGDGAATIEYKVKGADDSTYTTTAPSAAGDYVVRVTVAESKNYKAASATAEFTIGRATITDISVEQDGKLTYNGGDALTPVVVEKATSMNGQPVTFKYSNLQDGTYSSLPSFDKAGIYTVYYKATAPNHNETTGSFTVTVEKAIVTEPTIASKPFNNSAQKADISDTDLYTVVKNDGGTAKGEYDVILKLKDAANYKWSTTDSAEVTLKFVICAAENSWMTEPSISGWTYGRNANEPAYAAKYGTVKVMYTGKANDGSDYNSESTPTKAGDYTATFTVEGTADYSGLSKQVNFTVAKATYDMTGAKWDYTAAFDYDGKEHTVTVIGLPSGVTVSGYEGNKATVVGNYTAKVTFSYDGNNYNAPALADLTWSIKNYWTPTEYAVNGSGWMNQDFVISAMNGYRISLTNTADGTWSTDLTYSAETADGSVTFYLKNDKTGAISLAKTVNYKLDKTAPVGWVEFDERTSWEEFVSNITFGLFYKDEVTIKVTANDILSDVAKIEYASSNEAETLDEVMKIADWKEYNGSFGVTLEDAKKFVYFVRITDNAGNVTYLSTDGAEYDTTAPVIEGIENGKTYYTTQRFTVKESNLESVTVNGNPSMTFALGGNTDKEYVIVATDKAGNTTTITVTMKPIKELAKATEDLGNNNVTSDDEQALKDLVAKLDVLIADPDTSDDGEKETLQQHKVIAESLLKTIDDTKAEIARIDEELNKFNGDTVNSDDAPALEQLAKDIKELLDGDNLTDAERTALTEDAGKVTDMQKTVADTTAENKRISDAVDSYDLTTVTSEDKDDLEQLLADINKQLESTNLTEEEISELNGDKKAVEDLLTKIEGTDKLIDKLIGDVDGYTDDTVKSTDKDAIEQIIEDIDALLETENLTEDEKKDLEDAKDKAEGLLDTIDEATKATETENTEMVKDVTAENVTPEDKTDLEKAKEDLEKTLEDYGDNYTDDEKKAIEDEIKRIDDALEVIGSVEEVEDLIDKIPENITKNDEDAIKAADDAYNALTDYKKSLVDEDAKKTLADAMAALAELNKPADPDSPQTGDNTNLWPWWLLLIVSATGVIILSAEQRKRKAMK